MVNIISNILVGSSLQRSVHTLDISHNPLARFHSSTFIADIPRWITSSVFRAANAKMDRPNAGLSKSESEYRSD